MEKKKLSRAQQIDMDQCIKNAGGSKFDLVIQASAHARELSRIHQLRGHTEYINPVVSALLDIQNGKTLDK